MDMYMERPHKRRKNPKEEKSSEMNGSSVGLSWPGCRPTSPVESVYLLLLLSLLSGEKERSRAKGRPTAPTAGVRSP